LLSTLPTGIRLAVTVVATVCFMTWVAMPLSHKALAFFLKPSAKTLQAQVSLVDILRSGRGGVFHWMMTFDKWAWVVVKEQDQGPMMMLPWWVKNTSFVQLLLSSRGCRI
jgi:hypothetical protein